MIWWVNCWWKEHSRPLWYEWVNMTRKAWVSNWLPVRMLFSSSTARSSLIISNDESTRPRMYSFVIRAVDLSESETDDIVMRKHSMRVQCSARSTKDRCIHAMLVTRGYARAVCDVSSKFDDQNPRIRTGTGVRKQGVKLFTIQSKRKLLSYQGTTKKESLAGNLPGVKNQKIARNTIISHWIS